MPRSLGIPRGMRVNSIGGPLRRLARADRRAFDAVAAAHLPGLEYVLPRLSRAADHGMLWFGTAAALSATRRPRLRRAALRGAIGIAVASPAVNLLGKQAFRRKRPVIDLVPPVRIRWKLPTSHAFPSGHTASAAAFATGVAMEAPASVALPVAGAAAAVAFARVYTGAHFPGDVLAGAGIGMAAALGTRLVWPARPAVAHVIRTTTAPVGITEDGQGVVAVVNCGAGGGASVVGLLEKGLPAAEIIVMPEGEDLMKVLDEAASRARVLAVAGGDGTTNAGAQAALRHDVPLLTVPGGTLDHFTRALGIEHPADAIAAYKGGCLARVDLGSVRQPGEEELIFLNTAGFGAYTELVDRRERLQGRLGKWPAMVVAAVRTLRHSEPIDVTVDGRPRRVWLAFVGNCAYGSRGPAPTWREHLDDGLLDIRMVSAKHRVPRARAVAAVLFGHLHLMPGYSHWTSTRLEVIASGGELRLARDGETSSVSPVVRFGKRPAELRVFCPPRG